MKVTINTHGHSVEIDTDEQGMTARRLTNLAMSVWNATVATAQERPGPAFGLTREIQHQHHGWADLRDGERPHVQ